MVRCEAMQKTTVLTVVLIAVVAAQTVLTLKLLNDVNELKDKLAWRRISINDMVWEKGLPIFYDLGVIPEGVKINIKCVSNIKVWIGITNPNRLLTAMQNETEPIVCYEFWTGKTFDLSWTTTQKDHYIVVIENEETVSVGEIGYYIQIEASWHI